MFRPDDPFSPRGSAFDEPWQAQVLALAEALVRAEYFSGGQWAQALGSALREAEMAGEADTNTTYYMAAVTALERLSEAKGGITAGDRQRRMQEWEHAYRHTPHGRPVVLGASSGHCDQDRLSSSDLEQRR